MSLTNNHNLPDWLYKTVKHLRDKYDPGEADYSTTRLLLPPLIVHLESQYETSQDLTEALPSFIGTALHDSIEEALENDSRYIVERRFYKDIDVDGITYKIGGKIDLYDTETQVLSDAKVSSIYKFLFGDKFDYVAQGSINRWLMEPDYPVSEFRINAIPKDWRNKESLYNSEYPNYPFQEIPLELWPIEETKEFVRNKIREFQADNPRYCTQEEMWYRPGKVAVMRKGQKKAVKLFDSLEEANIYAMTGKNMYVEERKGEYKRCESYCPVKKWCPVWQ